MPCRCRAFHFSCVLSVFYRLILSELDGFFFREVRYER
nr:MAG TPA: hypothetical protein [Caudoviricetes sp.]DAN81603.1 MAG TPA: hypothetical protein [Caudoviricetes sp.]